jgi:hypothetical protein
MTRQEQQHSRTRVRAGPHHGGNSSDEIQHETDRGHNTDHRHREANQEARRSNGLGRAEPRPPRGGYAVSKRAGGRAQYTHLKEIAEVALGQDPSDIDRIYQSLLWAGASVGRSGVATQAIAALDVPLWDLKARGADLPLAKFIGAHREISDGVTILTASTAEQYAVEENGSGLFTGLLVDALNGAAANLLGDVTPGSVYAHIDQSLGPWVQRTVFKTNVKKSISLRKTEPPIDLEALQELTKHFPTPDHQFQLDPSYEPKRSSDERNDPAPDPAKNAVFATLQQCVKVNLVRPIGVEHMWNAAMESKPCVLTALGRHYWNLVARGLI